MNVLILEENKVGTDYIVGDIHGCYTLLEKSLKFAGFDKTKDRLLCVGDLIDRGPESIKFLDYLKEPWFYSAMGNHEDLALTGINEFLLNNIGALNLWYDNGGSWYENHKDKTNEIIKALCDLPLIIEVKIGDKNVAICHAEFPLNGMTYPLAKEILNSPLDFADYAFDNLVTRMLWGRTRIAGYDGGMIEGIDYMFHGHTPVRDIKSMYNYVFCDLGAFYTNKLPVINVKEYLYYIENPVDNKRNGIYFADWISK